MKPSRKPVSFAQMLEGSSFFEKTCEAPNCNNSIGRDERFCEEHRCTFITEDGLRCLEMKDQTTLGSVRCEAHNLLLIKGNRKDEISVIDSNVTETESLYESESESRLVIPDETSLEATLSPSESISHQLPHRFDSVNKKVTSFKIWPEAIDVSDDVLYDCKRLYGHKLEKSAQVTMGIYLIDRLVRDKQIQNIVNSQLDGTESDADFFQALWDTISKRLDESL